MLHLDVGTEQRKGGLLPSEEAVTQTGAATGQQRALRCNRPAAVPTLSQAANEADQIHLRMSVAMGTLRSLWPPERVSD